MAIVDTLAAAQGGRFFANAGKAAGVAESDARAAISALAPAIAEKLKDKAESDPDAFDQLLDLLEEGGDNTDLDDADAMTGAEALEDGGAILDDLYGSRAAATAALGKVAPVTGHGLDTLSAISATSVLAALAASNAQALAGSSEPAEADAGGSGSAAGGGLMAVIMAALIKGLTSGVLKSLGVRQRRRPRRRYGYYYGYGRRPPRRRRKRRPGIDTIFRDVLGGRR
jgi:hypothetical protein